MKDSNFIVCNKSKRYSIIIVKNSDRFVAVREMIFVLNIFNDFSLFLKWENQIIGRINTDYSISLVECDFNPVVDLYFGTKKYINTDEFKHFLSERIFSKTRKDVHSLLARLGAKEYDIFHIAKSTRAFNLADRFWISYSEKEEYETTFIAIFRDLYHHKLNVVGDSIASPSGNNIKQYVFYEKEFGIAKQQMHPYSTDAVNEVIAYRLGKLFGVGCCEANMLSANTVFSRYEYDFNKEFLIHARNIANGEILSLDNYSDIIDKYFPESRENILKMILFDFIIQQDDRHMSNWAILMNPKGEKSLYKLYDNGRSLFYESDEEMVAEALANPIAYSNSFGLVGTYYDAVVDISANNNVAKLINLNIEESEINNCFDGFEKYPDWKREACVSWIIWTVNTLKNFGWKRNNVFNQCK